MLISRGLIGQQAVSSCYGYVQFCSFVQVSYFPTPVVRAIIKKFFSFETRWLTDYEMN